ncbi:hypothetical protein U1Q18_007609, partial [Sarracenia purpurea var. burkii]
MVIREVTVFKIPPRTTRDGYSRGQDLDRPPPGCVVQGPVRDPARRSQLRLAVRGVLCSS